MHILSAIILGLVQGLTEFLPVSSSGHLVIAKYLIPEMTTSGVLFEVFLHAGTMLAILIYFRSRLVELVKSYWKLLIIASIPAGIVGVLFDDLIEQAFSSILFVGWFLLLTATFTYLTDKTKGVSKTITIKNALLIGCAQCVAILPGVSRSGSTIFAGTKLGIKRREAAEFSFLLSIPAILGANTLQLMKYGIPATDSLSVFAFGFISAFISGYFAIGFLLKVLNSKKFSYFSAYCVVVSLVIFLFMR